MADVGEPLSERELAVLQKLAAGQTNREIAHELDISPNTVKVHLRNIFTKLGVASRTEATTAALQRGLLTMPGIAQSYQPSGELVTQPTIAEITPAAGAAAAARGAHVYWRTAAVVMLGLTLVLASLIILPRLRDDGAAGEEPTSASIAGFEEQRLNDSDWLVSVPMTSGRANMALAAVGLDLYAIGGEVDAGVLNIVEVFDTTEHEWRAAGAKPTAVADAGAAVLFGEIIVPGGKLTDGQPTSVVEAYSPANDAWRPVTPLPEPVAGGLALSDGEELFVIGGWDGQEYLAEVWAYDPATDRWQSMPPISRPRAHAAGGIVNDRLYVVGGEDGDGPLTDCEFFDSVAAAWNDCEPLITARTRAEAAVVANNQLYVIGGQGAGVEPFAEMLDARLGRWQRIDLPMLDEKSDWRDLGVASVETRVYALGGRIGNEIQDANYALVTFTHRTFLPTVGGE
jgi:DNA-binding CsgD family transcriptional regulator